MTQAPARVLLIALAGLLGACSSLLTSKAPPPQNYLLRPSPPQAPAQPVPVSVQLLRPAVQPGLDSPRIALTRPGNRLDYYAGASWGGPLSEVVQSLASQVLRGSGAFAAVDTDRGGFGAEAVLAITVRRFEAEYGADDGAPPRAHVLLECTLGDRVGRRTLASFDAEAVVPAAENRLGAVVAAMERAANQALAQVVERSAAALAAAR